MKLSNVVVRVNVIPKRPFAIFSTRLYFLQFELALLNFIFLWIVCLLSTLLDYGRFDFFLELRYNLTSFVYLPAKINYNISKVWLFYDVSYIICCLEMILCSNGRGTMKNFLFSTDWLAKLGQVTCVAPYMLIIISVCFVENFWLRKFTIFIWNFPWRVDLYFFFLLLKLST